MDSWLFVVYLRDNNFDLNSKNILSRFKWGSEIAQLTVTQIWQNASWFFGILDLNHSVDYLDGDVLDHIPKYETLTIGSLQGIKQ